jgi:polysaccharide transporter, PST family
MSQSLVASKSINKSTADAFAAGVLAMLVINIVQRLVGLARNLGFSMYLTEDQLGLWSLANSFLIIAPPCIVLGLPGSFGKFVEHYRQLGALKSYLRRVTWICGITLVAIALGLLCIPQQLAVALYGQSQAYSVIVWTIITLAVLTAHNFLYELVIALRQIRLASIMQFISSAAFCFIGVLAIFYYQTWTALLPAYAISCLLAMLPGLYAIVVSRADFEDKSHVPVKQMWNRLVPFAVAMWTTNLLSNAFELCDRYMILHLTEADAVASQALVGQYYCSRIIPNLLLSLAVTVSGIVLPYLSADWEQKQHAKIVNSMNAMLMVICMVLTALSVAAIATAPILFDWILLNRFSLAFNLLPLGLAQAIWSGLAMIASAYLLCAEKGRQNVSILAFVLLLNIALNWPLIKLLGLHGAAITTTVSNAVLFVLVCWRLHREGCPLRGRTLIVCSLPICLLFGNMATLAVMMLLAVLCGRTDWLLNSEDRQAINNWILPRVHRLGLSLKTIW